MAILYIHGLFPGLLPATPAGWICPELPGYGTHATTAEATLPLAVEYVRGLITEPAHLVGHSIGGAIAVLLAARHPECVASVINVEGNFTVKDAFWSSHLAGLLPEEAQTELACLRENPEAWLLRSEVPPTPEALELAVKSLATPSRTVQSMAKSVVEITALPDYLHEVQAVFDHKIPMHLIAGELSRATWDVPDFVMKAAASVQLQAAAGHMMMWNDAEMFRSLVERTI